MSDDDENEDATSSEHQAAQTQQQILDDAIAKARDYLSKRSQVIAAGVIAVVWGLLAGESKAIPLESNWKVALDVAVILSLIALLFDYCQYLFEFMDARYDWGRWLGSGRWFMFVAKQLLSFAAAVILVVVASLIVLHPAAEAQDRSWSVWAGTVWSEGNKSSADSVLFVGKPDPYTGKIKVTRDRQDPCEGERSGDILVVVCPGANIRLAGQVQGEKNYAGEWTATNSKPYKGRFSYRWVKIYKPQS